MPQELTGAERITDAPDYDLDRLRSQRSYFPREPRSNVDRVRCPPGLGDRCREAAVASLGSDVAQALAGDADEPVTARFFVIHDTAGTTEYGLERGQTDPSANGSTRGIHLWISARATHRQRDWHRPGFGTKMEMGAENRHFLHIELSRDPQLTNAPTLYNDSQYERLAFAYLFASARKGRFLTVTSHNEVDRACVVYDDVAGRFRDYGHHDPEKFDLARWYGIVATLADLPDDATFGIEPQRVNGINQGGQKNVIIDYVKGAVDDVDQYGPVPRITSANSDAARHKKVRHPNYGEYYDLPVTMTVNGRKVLPRDA
ncbi:MAG TPA: hypothetical protein VEX35_00960 [Allosphingosinicella sp.]|nr:hypothetical protein [Allosphingosinicella sp.]